MNKIVQKRQFQLTFYATMEMEVGLSLNALLISHCLTYKVQGDLD